MKIFWEDHDPTQGMRQGNDVGTQYRSAIYCYGPAQLAAAQASSRAYQPLLTKAGYGPITTEIREAPEFYYAEVSRNTREEPVGLLCNRRHGVSALGPWSAEAAVIPAALPPVSARSILGARSATSSGGGGRFTVNVLVSRAPAPRWNPGSLRAPGLVRRINRSASLPLSLRDPGGGGILVIDKPPVCSLANGRRGGSAPRRPGYL